MKRVEFIEKVLLVVLKREIHRADCVIGRRKLEFYPYVEVVTLKFNGVINTYVMGILTEYFSICVVDGEVCLSGVRNQTCILQALGIKLT